MYATQAAWEILNLRNISRYFVEILIHLAIICGCFVINFIVFTTIHSQLYSQALSLYTNKHITIMCNAHDQYLMAMSDIIMILVIILKLFMFSVNLTNIFLHLSNFHIIIFRVIDDIYHDFSVFDNNSPWHFMIILFSYLLWL